MKVSDAPERIWIDAKNVPPSDKYAGTYYLDNGEDDEVECTEYILSDLSMQWNDNMDEAPRDGHDFIVTDGEEVVCVYFTRYGHWKPDEYEIRFAHRQCGEESLWFTPVAWMPLPEPPK